MFTDSLGNPINVGDVIAYPVKSGSSSAVFQQGTVEMIDPLIEDPMGPRKNFVYRESQVRSKPPPTRTPFQGHGHRDRSGNWVRDDSKLYVLVVKGKSWNGRDTRKTIHSVEKCIVITSLVQR